MEIYFYTKPIEVADFYKKIAENPIEVADFFKKLQTFINFLERKVHH
jgi:hypothetical protein